ncbi:MAG TPA: PilZ domain-containing protein, partial [Treponemataceae bacterium]|nr:PilZ domain-containing protein [Treponemataceae bacterium]
MIAVIIAESEDYIKELSQKLDDEGLKIIRYTWLLKALDNLEEINPQRIYVNALDYPRHWKTLVQYSNGNFLEKKPEIFLYQIDNFGEEEREKAKCLDVKLIADVK